MKTLVDILRNMDATAIRAGFNDYAKRQSERLYPDVYTPDRPNVDAKKGGGDMIRIIAEGFKKLDNQ